MKCPVCNNKGAIFDKTINKFVPCNNCNGLIKYLRIARSFYIDLLKKAFVAWLILNIIFLGTIFLFITEPIWIPCFILMYAIVILGHYYSEKSMDKKLRQIYEKSHKDIDHQLDEIEKSR